MDALIALAFIAVSAAPYVLGALAAYVAYKIIF